VNRDSQSKPSLAEGNRAVRREARDLRIVGELLEPRLVAISKPSSGVLSP
jgi:hypothetical protein